MKNEMKGQFEEEMKVLGMDLDYSFKNGIYQDKLVSLMYYSFTRGIAVTERILMMDVLPANEA